MALAATTIWEVETTGNDTNNSGAFDPGQTAGMFTDGAATVATSNAPVFSSASYNFVAGDVGAWVFIASGTNWTPGWYKITSVASNKATLIGTIGLAVVALHGTITATTVQLGPSTVIGCATTASPTGATWSIDYSQQSGVQFTYTDLISAGAGLTVSSVLKPFGNQQVGNSLVITGGTNFNTGRYVIASVGASPTFIATVVGPTNITSGLGAAGTGGQGGALASPGILGAHIVTTNQCFILTGTYTVASASTNIATGCINTSANTLVIEGYAAVRGDLEPLGTSGTRPTIKAGSISTFTLIIVGGSSHIRCLIIDGNSQTSSRGLAINTSEFYKVHGQNFTNGAFAGTSACFYCSATGCSTVIPFTTNKHHFACVAYSNTITGFNGGHQVNCLAYNNSGASTDGFGSTSSQAGCYNCTSYGNGRNGFTSIDAGALLINCVAEANTGVGFSLGNSSQSIINCATFNNTGGQLDLTVAVHEIVLPLIAGSSSFFTNPGSGDFSLNTTIGGGALLRAAGYPGIFPVGLTTSYLDIGAVQHADPAGGGQSVSIFSN